MTKRFEAGESPLSRLVPNPNIPVVQYTLVLYIFKCASLLEFGIFSSYPEWVTL